MSTYIDLVHQDVLNKLNLISPSQASELISETYEFPTCAEIPTNLNTISTLASLHSLNGCVVSYDVYIADIFDEEIFNYELPNGKSTLLLECYPCEESPEAIQSSSKLAERSVCYAIPLPRISNKQYPGIPSSQMEEEKKKLINSTVPPEAQISDYFDQLNKAGIFHNGRSQSHLFPCILKIYGGDRKKIKLRSEFKITGVLHIEAGTFSQNSQECLEFKDYNSTYLETLVPRIHVSALQPIEIDSKESLASYEFAVNYFTNLCAGDEKAAKILLCSLSSNVVSRINGLPLNILSINLIGCEEKVLVNKIEKKLGDFILEGIAQVNPFITIVPFTLSHLNSEVYMPKKNYEINILSRCIPMSIKNPILINECVLTQGTLNKNGINNLEFFNNILQNQILNCDFEYYQVPLEVSCPVIAISSSKSLLTFQIKKQIDIKNISLEFSEGMAKGINLLIECSKTRLKDVKVSESFCEEVEKKFVKIRECSLQNGKPMPSGEDLNLWLSVSKILAALKGRNEIFSDDFEESLSILLQ